MKNLFSTLFLIFAFHFQALAQQIGTPYITNFPPDVYKAETQNWAIVQDKRGIIYVGNGGGVLEYDGITWRLIKTPSIVRSLAIDSKGRIYVGIRGDFGYLDADSLGKYQYLSLKEKIPKQDREFNDVWKIYVSDNQVFFQSYEKIVILQNDKFKGLYPKARFGLSFLVNNTFYVREVGKGLMKLKNDSLTLLAGGERFAEDRIYAILPFTQNEILIATRKQGVWLYKPSQNTFSKPIGFEAIDNFLRQHPVYCGMVLQKGTFALGTTTGGIIVFDAQGHLQSLYTTETGLQDNGIKSLYYDNNQQLWAGLDNGISRLQPTLPFQRFTEKNGLKGFPMSIDFFGKRLYVGTSQYVCVQKPDGNFETIIGTEGQNWQFYPINGTLLMANYTGLFEIKGNQAIPIVKSTGFLSLSPLDKQANYLLAGLNPSGLCVLEYGKGTWKIKNPIKGFTKPAFKIVQDKEGGIWVFTFPQLYRLTLNETFDSAVSVMPCTTEEGLPTEKAIPYLLHSGEVVFGTEKGIYRYLAATNTFEPHPTFSMLKGEITAFQEQRNRDIWFQEKTGTGVYEKGVLKYAKGKYQLFKQPFHKFNEEGVFGFYTFCVASDTAVFIGTTKNLLQYNPLKTVDYTIPYHTLIRRVFAKDSLLFGGATEKPNEFEHIKGAVIPYSQNNLVFHYAATFYEDVEKNLYSYRLSGSDTTWSAWESDVKKEYTSLWEGDYTFEVKSKNQYREIGKTASYSFRVLPPFYRTWWAYSLYVTFFLGLGVVILKFYTRRLVAQKEHLEALVKERTAKVQQAKEKIEVQAEELQKLNQFKDRLFSIIAHDLRSPMANLELTISVLDPDILNSSDLDMIKNQLTKQFEVTDKTLQDLLQWTKDQMKGETIEAKTLNLTEIVSEKINLFTGIAQSKNITLLSEFMPDTQVFADENHVNIILQNLLSNALKFTYAGGTITLTSQKTDKMFQITVKDTGKGMNEEQQNKLFSTQHFTTKGTSDEKGNGLGLHLVKDLVEKNGGKIWVTSQEGKGSEFCFLLPMVR